MTDLARFQEALGVLFRDPVLLRQALCHSSYVNENPGIAPVSNERLEYLGDAVLGLVVAERLYHDFPGFNEGEMTRLRAALVRRETVAAMAEALGLADYLYLGKGEETSGGRRKLANLAGAMEAVIGAVFLDQGLEAARELSLRLLAPELEKLASSRELSDYKTRLQEFVQARAQKAPVYRVVASTGPDHSRQFTVEVKVGTSVLGRGSGRSKKAAENEAARAALESFDRLSCDFTL